MVRAYRRTGPPPILHVEPSSHDAVPETKDVYANGKHIGVYRVYISHLGLATIGWVAVRGDVRGRGYGRLIVEKILDDLRAKGVTLVTLLATEEARPFWGHMGFYVVEEPSKDSMLTAMEKRL